MLYSHSLAGSEYSGVFSALQTGTSELPRGHTLGYLGTWLTLSVSDITLTNHWMGRTRECSQLMIFAEQS